MYDVEFMDKVAYCNDEQLIELYEKLSEYWDGCSSEKEPYEYEVASYRCDYAYKEMLRRGLIEE